MNARRGHVRCLAKWISKQRAFGSPKWQLKQILYAIPGGIKLPCPTPLPAALVRRCVLTRPRPEIDIRQRVPIGVADDVAILA